MPQWWLVMNARHATWVCLPPGLGLHTSTAGSVQDVVPVPLTASPAVALELPCTAAQVAGSTQADQPADAAREGPASGPGGSAGAPHAQAADNSFVRALYLPSSCLGQETDCYCPTVKVSA